MRIVYRVLRLVAQILNGAATWTATSHSGLNFKGSDESRLPNVIVVSSAIPQDNVEILHAKSAGVPV